MNVAMVTGGVGGNGVEEIGEMGGGMSATGSKPLLQQQLLEKKAIKERALVGIGRNCSTYLWNHRNLISELNVLANKPY